MNSAVVAEYRKDRSVSVFWEQHGAMLTTVVSAVLAIGAWQAGMRGWSNMEVPLYIAAYVTGGYRKAWEGLQTLIVERDLDVDLLMVIAAIGAASIGYWQDGAILIFIFALSSVLEGYTLEKTNHDIRSIMKLRPEKALVLRGTAQLQVRVEDLRAGDVVLTKPGERIPADGIIQDGYSAIDQSSITGESIPVDKGAGDEVYAGTINGQGALRIEVTKQLCWRKSSGWYRRRKVKCRLVSCLSSALKAFMPSL